MLAIGFLGMSVVRGFVGLVLIKILELVGKAFDGGPVSFCCPSKAEQVPGMHNGHLALSHFFASSMLLKFLHKVF